MRGIAQIIRVQFWSELGWFVRNSWADRLLEECKILYNCLHRFWQKMKTIKWKGAVKQIPMKYFEHNDDEYDYEKADRDYRQTIWAENGFGRETVTNAFSNPPNRQPESNMPQFEREFVQFPCEICAFCKTFVNSCMIFAQLYVINPFHWSVSRSQPIITMEIFNCFWNHIFTIQVPGFVTVWTYALSVLSKSCLIISGI